jgi:flavodoxin
MKKSLTILLLVLMISVLASCGRSTNDTAESPPVAESLPVQSNPEEGQSGDSILIAYFTMPESDGTDAVASASRVVTDGEILGNTEFIAQTIQSSVGGDLFAIETVQDYPGAHDDLLDFAENEQDEQIKPELSSHVENMEKYDVIFLGYPNWWADMPMPLYSFLEEYDLSGKRIIPFITHDGSRFSRTIRTIEELQPDATVVPEGFNVSRNSIVDAEGDVKEWAQGLDL